MKMIEHLHGIQTAVYRLENPNFMGDVHLADSPANHQAQKSRYFW
jgi:hypothetical protein